MERVWVLTFLVDNVINTTLPTETIYRALASHLYLPWLLQWRSW